MADMYIKKLKNGKGKRITIKTFEEETKEAKAFIAKIKEHPEQPLKEIINSNEALALQNYYYSYASEEEKKELEPFLDDIFALIPPESKIGFLGGMQDSFNIIQASMGTLLSDIKVKEKGFSESFNKMYMKSMEELEAFEIPQETITAMEKLTEQWGEAVKNMKIMTDETIDAINKNLELSFSPPGSWFTLSKVVAELKQAVDDKLNNDPFLIVFKEEIDKMKGEPEWAGVDLSYLTYDEVGKEQALEEATPHNRAIAEASRRAEERLKKQEEEEKQQPELFEVIENTEEKEAAPLKVEALEEGKPLTKQIHVTSLIQTALVAANIINLDKNIKIPTGIGKTRGEITDTLFVEIPKEARFVGITSLTAYEREVSNAVYTLFDLGYHYFTPAMLYKALTMQDRIPEGKEEELIETLEKLSMVKVTLEASEEIRKYTKDSKAVYERTDYYLPLYKERVILYGKEATVYYFRGDRPPILLEHAIKTKKVVTFNKELLLTKDKKGHVLNKTNDRIAINGYLARRIRQMKDPKTGNIKATQNNRINFDNMFTELQIPNENKDRKMRNRENALLILDHFKAEKAIKGYKIVRGGRGGSVLGVDVFF